MIRTVIFVLVALLVPTVARANSPQLQRPAADIAPAAEASPATAAEQGETPSEVPPALLAGPEPATKPAHATAPVSPPEPTLLLRVDLTNQAVTVLEHGAVKATWAISSGTREYATPTGTFTPTWTSKLHFSRQWDWAPMHYSVFFNKGVAFHATAATRMLGRPASHGCIRLTTTNAKTLFQLVHKHGLPMTRVEVQGTPLFEDVPISTGRRRGDQIARTRRHDGYGSFTTYGDDTIYYVPRRKRRYAVKTYSGNPFGSFFD